MVTLLLSVLEYGSQVSAAVLVAIAVAVDGPNGREKRQSSRSPKLSQATILFEQHSISAVISFLMCVGRINGERISSPD